MPKSYVVIIVAVEHDGNCTPTELVTGIGTTVDHMGLAMRIETEVGTMGHAKITECLGVDELQYEQVQSLIERRAKYDGT